MADEDDYIPEEAPEEIPEPTPAREQQGGLTDASREAIRGGVRNMRNPKAPEKAASKPEAVNSQPPAAKPANTSPPASSGGKLGDFSRAAGAKIEKLGKGYRKAQIAKNIAQNPKEAAKEAGKEYVKDVAREQILKRLRDQIAQKGIAGFLAAGWEFFVVVIIILIIIAVILFFVGFVIGFSIGGSSTSNLPTGYIDGNVEQSIAYPTNCTEEAMAGAINNFIEQCSNNSPLSSRGDIFVQAGKQSGLNPFFIAAQACKENQFATTGYAKNHPESYNTFGHKYGSWTKDYGTPGPTSPEGDRYMIYPNWEASLLAHTNIITHYINDLEMGTLLEIIDHYMTGNHVLYTNQVNNWMAQMFATAGCSSVSEGGSTAGPSVANTSIQSLISSAGFSDSDVAYAVVGNSGSTSNNADNLMVSASSIKAGVLLAYLYDNNVPNSGSSIDNSITEMITNSNNASANQVVNAVGGTSNVTSILNSHGISGVQLNREFGASGANDNLISANGAVQTLQAIMKLPSDKRQYALDKLYNGDTGTGQDYIRNALTGAIVYSKSGQGLNDSARNDIAIVQDGDNYSYIAVLVNTNSSNTATAQQLISSIAQEGIVIADNGASSNCK